MQLNSPGANALVSLKTPWWILPAGFVPAEPFHPQLRVVPQERIVSRAARLLQQGRKAEAHELVFAMARALHSPHRVDRASISIEIVPFSSQPPTVDLTGDEGKEGA